MLTTHNRIAIILLLVSGLLLSSCSNKTIKSSTKYIFASELLSPDQTELIRKHCSSFPDHTQLSIALIENGKCTFIGIRCFKDSILSIENKDKNFEIGSISKVFTATLLSNMAIAGDVKLSDNIRDYLKFPLNTGETITFEQLANHSSGLPRMPSNFNLFTTDSSNPYKSYGKENLSKYLVEKLKLKSNPGSSYAYSNLGAGLLGFLLEEIAEKSYEELLHEKIFSKYEMTRSTSKRDKVQDKLVKGRNPKGEVCSNWDFDVLVGAGGILSTVEDLSKFAKAQFNKENKELVQTRIPTYTINDNMKVGLGWHLPKSKSGRDWVWHNGGTGGYTSSMVLDTERESGVIILSNVSAFHKQNGNIDKLSFALLELLLKT